MSDGYTKLKNQNLFFVKTKNFDQAIKERFTQKLKYLIKKVAEY